MRKYFRDLWKRPATPLYEYDPSTLDRRLAELRDLGRTGTPRDDSGDARKRVPPVPADRDVPVLKSTRRTGKRRRSRPADGSTGQMTG